MMVEKQRYIVVHSDYAAGDTEGPYRDARVGDALVAPDKLRVYDGEQADGYLELSHDGYQGNIESTLGPVAIDGVLAGAHVSRHLGGGGDSAYVVATRAPLPADDGYAVGMRWLDTSDGYEYVCFENPPSAAIWRKPAAGVGLTEPQHEILDTLVHWINKTNWQEMVRSNGKVTNAIHWTDSGKTKKIREVVITRASGKVSQIDIIQYDGSGVETQRFVGMIARSGGKVASIQWTKTGSP